MYKIQCLSSHIVLGSVQTAVHPELGILIVHLSTNSIIPIPLFPISKLHSNNLIPIHQSVYITPIPQLPKSHTHTPQSVATFHFKLHYTVSYPISYIQYSLPVPFPYLSLHHVVPLLPHAQHKVKDVCLLLPLHHFHHGLHGYQCACAPHSCTAMDYIGT